jgi:hypothetical protein
MSPPNDKTGVAPEVLMAIIESDVHHLRTQSDRDRRGFAARLAEDRERLDRMEAIQGASAVQLARAADAIAVVAESGKAMQNTQSLLLRELHRGQGAIRFLRWVLGAGLAAEGLRLYLEHAR